MKFLWRTLEVMGLLILLTIATPFVLFFNLIEWTYLKATGKDRP